MDPLRLVMIGGWGHWGLALDEIAEMAEAELVGVAPAYVGEDLGELLRHRIFRAAVRRFDDYQSLLGTLKPDVAVVSTRLDRIAPVAMDAVRAGCHLICEKPLALDQPTLRQFHELVQQRGRKVLAMHTMRSLPVFRAARRVYREGQIGELVVVNVRKSYKWGTRPDWFAVRAVYGGTIPWIGIHALDIIHFITGRAFTAVAAMHGNRTQPGYPECEDHAVLIAEMEGGCHATVTLNFCRPESAATWGDDWVRVVGSRGTLEVNASAGWCRLTESGPLPVEVPLPKFDPMFRNFLGCVREGRDYEFATADAFRLTHVALAARDAADEGRVVRIEAW